MEILFPVAERGAAIAHTRTNQAVVGILLERMRDPSGGAADSEDRRRHRARKAEHADAYGQIKIQIGPQPLAFRDRLFDFETRSRRAGGRGAWRSPAQLACSSAARGSPSG